MTEPAEPAIPIALERDDAEELAEGIGALGSWLHQAPDQIRRDFARHAFPNPGAPGANTEDFLAALHHAWQHLCDALGAGTTGRAHSTSQASRKAP
jgi:hypothetical protein